jgi:hypothetical protein
MVSDFITLSSRRRTPTLKDGRFALLGVIALHHAHAAQRLGQPPRHFAVILPRSRKMGRIVLKRVLQNKDENADHRENDQRHPHAAMQQEDERHHRRQQAAHKLHQAGADQVAHAFHVAHDARNQQAAAVLVVEADRKQAYVPLHLLAQIGNHALRGLRQQLRV